MGSAWSASDDSDWWKWSWISKENGTMWLNLHSPIKWRFVVVKTATRERSSFFRILIRRDNATPFIQQVWCIQSDGEMKGSETAKEAASALPAFVAGAWYLWFIRLTHLLNACWAWVSKCKEDVAKVFLQSADFRRLAVACKSTKQMYSSKILD